jgi:hypothetical protein
MTEKMDKVITKMVYVTELVLCQTNEKFRDSSNGVKMRRILRLLEVHGLAKLVQRGGSTPTWTATEELIDRAGEYSGRAQPNPAPMPYDDSPAAIFARHRVRCINWVERDFKIDSEGPLPHVDKFSAAIAQHNVLERVLRKVIAIERECESNAPEVEAAPDAKRSRKRGVGSCEE